MAEGTDIGSLPLAFQIMAGVGIAIGSAIAYVVAKRKVPESGGDATQNILQGIYRVLGEMRTDASRHADENNRKLDEVNQNLDRQYDVMRDIRDRPRSR